MLAMSEYVKEYNRYGYPQTGDETVPNALNLKKNLFSIKEITKTPFEGENAEWSNHHHGSFREMRQGHQPVCDGIDVAIEPSPAHNLKEEVDKNGVHPNNRKKGKSLSMAFHVNPPITQRKAQQTPPARCENKGCRGNALDDRCHCKIQGVTNDQTNKTGNHDVFQFFILPR